MQRMDDNGVPIFIIMINELNGFVDNHPERRLFFHWMS